MAVEAQEALWEKKMQDVVLEMVQEVLELVQELVQEVQDVVQEMVQEKEGK